MKTNIEPLCVIGKEIRSVRRIKTGIDLETDLETFRVLIDLVDALPLELFPGDIRICTDLSAYDTNAIEIMDVPDVKGKKILALITYEFGQSADNLRRDHPASDLYDSPRHIALILSHGFAAINVYMCGAATEIHVQPVAVLISSFNKEWRDFWTHEPVDLRVYQ